MKVKKPGLSVAKPSAKPHLSRKEHLIQLIKKDLVLFIGIPVILAFIMTAGGKAAVVEDTKIATTQVASVSTPTPVQAKEAEITPTPRPANEKIFYANNGFSFYYPGILELSQEYVGDATQWIPEVATRVYTKENADALTLHESPGSFSPIAKGAKFTLWNKGYFDPRSEVTITSVSDEPVLIGNSSTLKLLECGKNCRYAVARFESNKKYYELIYNLNAGDISVFKEILASMRFFDANARDWVEYVNKEGGYSVKYPASFIVMEKVSFSVDGVRRYNSNLFTAYPPKSSPISDGISVYYEIIGDQTFDEYLQEHRCSYTEDKKRFTLNGELAEYKRTACGITTTSDVSVKHHDKLYKIGVKSANDPALETFKFTD